MIWSLINKLVDYQLKTLSLAIVNNELNKSLTI